MVDQKLKDQWEKLWKKFSDIIGFTYDNEGVISSLKRHKSRADQPTMQHALDEQIKEVTHLIEHHKDDLLELTDQGIALAKKIGKSIDQEGIELKEAIKNLDLQGIHDTLGKIKKRVQTK